MMREQYVSISAIGSKCYFKDREMTILHREDGPAVELGDGTKYWYIDDKLHREDGPAIECNGIKEWYINGKLHREDGPAVVLSNGDKSWYINGEELTEEEFNARMNTVELTLDEIAAKFNVSVDRIKVRK